MINRLLTYRNLNMSIPEYCQLQRGEITLNDIYLNRKAKRAFDKFCSNKQMFNFLVFLFAFSLVIDKLVYAAQINPAESINLGNYLLSLTQNIGYWACNLFTWVNLAKTLSEGKYKVALKIVCIASIAFASIYSLPGLVNFIKTIFY